MLSNLPFLPRLPSLELAECWLEPLWKHGPAKKRGCFFFFTGLIFQLDPWSARDRCMKTETEEGEKEV